MNGPPTYAAPLWRRASVFTAGFGNTAAALSCWMLALAIIIRKTIFVRQRWGQGAFATVDDYAIVEIKFNEVIPRWLTSHVAQFECELRRVSKYCEGVETLVLDRMPA